MSQFDQILAGLALVGTPESLLALFAGIAIGVFGGAFPGMSATTTVALTLPFTFTMAPVQGILLLLGVYKGSIFGGCIPAILIRAAGNVASSATVIDGYAMTQKGKGGQALNAALWSSCFSDLLSNLSLILLAGWLASFALNFRPPEFFTLIVFALLIVAGVSGTSVLRGLVSTFLGLLLATIGLDLVYGTERFTFGQPNLMEGLNYVTITIGMSAIAEFLRTIWNPPSKQGITDRLGKIGLKFAGFKKSIKSVLRGSVIGVVLGSIPGIGAAPAAFLSYSEARRTSKNKKNFGSGEIEGVAAAESANNGVTGATLIPLLALGVPGDIITAIMIGAFAIHGLSPGPLMFVTHGEIIYGLFAGLLLSTFFLFIVGSVAIRIFGLISKIPNSILYPAVLTICMFGVYSIRSSIFDVAVMFIIGWFGFFMGRFGLMPAPFLVGLTLGPLLEDNLHQAMLMSGNSVGILFSSPITWFFWIMILFTLIAIVRSSKWTIVKEQKSLKEQETYDEKSQNDGKQNRNSHGEQSNQESQKTAGNSQEDLIQKAFATLGLKPGTSAKDVKRQYHELHKKLHPDHNQNSPQFEELLKDINQAHETLKRAGLSL